MAATVGEFVLRRLCAWGVDRVFGYPGDGSAGLNLAFHQVGDELAFVQTRHEELAAFAACGHAKLTGEVGVCMATSGPGAVHLLNGLYDARLDHAPVVALVGQQARMSMGGSYQQEVDLHTLFKDVAGEFVETCMVPEQAAQLVDRAVRTALAERTVTCVIFPSDVQELPAADPPREHGAVLSSIGYERPLVRPGDEQLRRAAAVLNDGERVAIVAGAGAGGAQPELEHVADVLGAGVAKALNGRALLSDEQPWVTGPIGLLGSESTAHMIGHCDTLLLVGTGFPYAEWLPEPGQARAVQIDIDARRLGLRHPLDEALVGDSAETLRALLPMLDRKEDRSWRDAIEDATARWWRALEERALVPAEPVNPQLVFHELSKRLPDRAIVLGDSGSNTVWWARHLRLREGMDAALSGTLASMGPALPYALAAKLAHPDRPVIATLGDGAMQMLGINGLIDLVAHREHWRGANEQLVVLVLDNGDLNMVTWEQRAMSGEPRVDVTQLLPPFDSAGYARLLGIEGIRVERPEDVGPAWDRALAARGPALLAVTVDPEVAPLPPEIRPAQAKAFASAVVRGDPARGRFLRDALRQKLADYRAR